MFENFTCGKVELPSGIKLQVRTAGEGPAVLLLHGYPQTHVCWHKVAPRLVEAGYLVVLSDLRGYGDSDKPTSVGNHLTYSKREMAADQAALMQKLGHKTYSVVGHDRGARVAHRMARDYPDAVASVSFLDIVPTEHMYAANRTRICHRILPLVLFDSACTSPGAPDRQRSGLLFDLQAQRLEQGQQYGIRKRSGL